MNSIAASQPMDAARAGNTTAGTAMLDRAVVPLGRVLFSLIFIWSGVTHLSAGTIAYAAQAGVPLAGLLVPASGVLAALGGLSVALGWHARLGAAALVLFLVPVTLQMHAFWAMPDPMMAQVHLAMFMKNLAMLGGALFVARVGAGPVSLDARAGR